MAEEMVNVSQFDRPPPWRQPATQPVFQSPPVVLAVIVVLVAVHALLWLAGESWQVWSLYAFAFIPARFGGGETIPMIWGSQYWSFLTHALLHADLMHLGFNSLWLLIFGTVVARRLGPWRFLVLAAIAAMAGAAAMLLLHWGEASIMIGASGSVSGLMAAAMPIMFGGGYRWGPAQQRDLASAHVLSPGEFLRNRRALTFTAIWLAITLYSGATGWTGNSFLAEARIAWEAHVGGFAAGLIGFYLLDRRRMRRPPFGDMLSQR